VIVVRRCPAHNEIAASSLSCVRATSFADLDRRVWRYHLGGGVRCALQVGGGLMLEAFARGREAGPIRPTRERWRPAGPLGRSEATLVSSFSCAHGIRCCKGAAIASSRTRDSGSYQLLLASRGLNRANFAFSKIQRGRRVVGLGADPRSRPMGTHALRNGHVRVGMRDVLLRERALTPPTPPKGLSVGSNGALERLRLRVGAV
jgi:hypothetical protein